MIIDDSQLPIIIFMDCQMPIMDGFTATRAIRQGLAGERHKNSIIIAMTAGAMASEKEQCLECCMDDFISKPIDTSTFKQKVIYWGSNKIKPT